ncbi:hypothetical protein GCM10022254_15500 [Actinomadura meridiana]|uniref:Uncharacterized protein n=1 Tax=Actinomadura meridiana TaxID=559626 RepID=A0ABP8BVF8_9ACTN
MDVPPPRIVNGTPASRQTPRTTGSSPASRGVTTTSGGTRYNEASAEYIDRASTESSTPPTPAPRKAATNSPHSTRSVTPPTLGHR